MLLSEEEFLEIKEVFVGQILEKLRSLARREAELLMRVITNHPTTPLPEMSARISSAIIKISDAMESTLYDLTSDDAKLVKELVVEHLPAALVDRVGERIWSETPETYLRWIMAKSLAARIVYREGYESVECMSTEKMGELALDYLRQESERRRLSAEIMGSELPNKERIARLLDRSGILPTLGDE